MTFFMAWAAMGKYGVYVWASYGLFFWVLIMAFVHMMIVRRRTWRLLQRWFRRAS